MKYALLSLLLFSMICPAYAASLSGRLFYTPAQRAEMEAARNHATLPAADTVPGPQDTVYNGYIRRSDGRTTLWINGQPRRLQQTPATPGKLKLPATPALKPGQEFNTQYGRVLESYERPAPAAPAATPSMPARKLQRTLPQPDDADTPFDAPRSDSSAPSAGEH
ncbi:MAG: hypothetical protein ACYCZJ_01145 [Sulfuriferula sp.]